MADWLEATIGELCRIKHGFAFKGEHFVDGGDLMILSPGNFRPGGGLQLRDGKETFYDGEFPPEFLLDEGDLLIAMTDLKQEAPILGSTIRVPQSGRYLHNQRLGLVTDIADQVDSGFLYYLLNSEVVRSWLRATATGSTVRHTAPERIYAAQVRLPPIEQQTKIAASLEALDRLTANNRRRIEILEEMARLIHREWFVHFRFPGHENVQPVDSDLGPIPEGWEVGVFGDLVEVSRDAANPVDIEPGAALVGLEHIPRRSTTIHEWNQAGEIRSRKSLFVEGDILFGKIRPYFHKVVLAPIDGYCSTDAIVFRPELGVQGRALAVASSDEFVAHAVQTSNGTKMPRANTDVLMHYPVPIPPESILKAFESTVGPINTLCQNLSAQMRVLVEARDRLLPRLISGDVDLSKLDLDLEPVA